MTGMMGRMPWSVQQAASAGCAVVHVATGERSACLHVVSPVTVLQIHSHIRVSLTWHACDMVRAPCGVSMSAPHPREEAIRQQEHNPTATGIQRKSSIEALALRNEIVCEVRHLLPRLNRCASQVNIDQTQYIHCYSIQSASHLSLS